MRLLGGKMKVQEPTGRQIDQENSDLYEQIIARWGDSPAWSSNQVRFLIGEIAYLRAQNKIFRECIETLCAKINRELP